MSSRILVVDDDVALSEMIGIMLHAEGFEVADCADGAQALDVFHEVSPDLVLLDLMLPNVDGIEICRQIRRESDVPIVMLTARSDTTDVVAGLEAGADDYVPKPFKPKELVARVRARLRGRDDSGEELVRLGSVQRPSKPSLKRVKVASPLGEHMSRVLADAWDTRVTVSEGKRKGKIIIEFAGSDDLQRLADLLLPHAHRQ